MRETLLIRLSGDGGASWHIARPAEPEPVSDGGTLEQAIAECEGRRVKLLVPGTDVVLYTAHLPGLRGYKLRQALPFALEDELAEDVDTLHFALGAAAGDGDRNVAVVARQHMETWLAPFRETGIEPDAIYPETLGVPWTQGENPGWTLLLDNEQVLVRTGPQSGFACEAGMLADVVALETLPDNLEVTVYAPHNEQARAEDLCACFYGASVEQKEYENTLACLAQGLDSQVIDLRQGAYAIHSGWQRWGMPFRATAVLLAALFVIHMGTLGARYVHLSDQHDKLQSQARQTFQQLFPADTRIEDLRAQTQAHLSELRQGGGADKGLFFLLEKTTQALQAAPGLTIRNLQYQNSALSISLHGSDLGALETLRKKFSTESRIKLQVQSANSGENGVNIRLRIGVASS